MSFNRDFAAKYFDIVAKMDDDSAAMFQRMVVHGVLMDDLENNRRTVSKAVNEILGEIREEVSKSLQSREGQPEAVSAAALVGVVSKSSEHWKDERRGPNGRWTVNFSASKEKNKPSKADKRAKQNVSVGNFDVTNALGRTGQESNRFSDKWHERGQEDSTTAGVYSRIEAGSHAMSQVGNATGNAKLRVAGDVGQFLGQYGPQAEAIIGPHMRRTAYRYRGTERVPDNELARIQRDQVANIGRREGLTSNAQFTTPMMNTAAHQAAINYLSKRIPQKSLAELQAKSGKIPPSEGVIINGDGKIITQAVGYMDDHYLPFNLKNLRGLQGGAYVRTRSSGGLTSEDIYTGLVSGARSVTVVSRSGVFTMDFEDDFRGGRRFNDKAAGMVSRYAHTLDAVQSKQVTRAPMSMEDRLRIRDEVEQEFDGFTPSEVEDEIKRRTTEAQTRPTLSRSEVDDINRKAASAAAEGGQGPRGQFSEREWTRIADDPKKRFLAYKGQMIEDALRDKEATKFQLDGEGYAVALDALREQYPYYIKNVQYIHNKDPRARDMGLSPETDSGYVKPKYNRPTAVQAGWYGEKIGAKKHSAEQTNYQNWSQRGHKLTPIQQGAATAAPEGEEATEESAVKKPANLRAAAERGRRSVQVQNQMKEAVQITKVAKANKELFPTLSAAQSSDEKLEQIVKDHIQSSKLMDEMKSYADELESAGQNEAETKSFQNRAGQIRSKLKAIAHLKLPEGNVQWNRNEYKGEPSPAGTYQFVGPAYILGSESGVYQRVWNQLTKEVEQQNPGIKIPKDDDKLRDLGNRFGEMWKLADSNADEETLVERLTNLNPTWTDSQTSRTVRLMKDNPAEAKNRWSTGAERIERLRRVLASGGDAVEKPAPAAAAAAAAEPQVTSTSSSIPSGASQYASMPKADQERTQLIADMVDWEKRSRDKETKDNLYRLRTGIMKGNHDDIYDALANLREMDNEGTKVIIDRMQKLGLVDDDFDFE